MILSTSTFQYKTGKFINKRVALDLIRFAPNGISRAELARQMGLTRSAISPIISDLKRIGLVDEMEARQTKSGRRPVMLAINPGFGNVIGIDMGATHVNIILADYSAEVIEEIDHPFSVLDGPKDCLDKVNQLVSELLVKNQKNPTQISAIGMGVPGPVAANAGVVSSPPIMPGWDGFPIQRYLEEASQIPVTIGNDADLGALGEWAYGAGRDESNLAYIKVGTGVGAGLIMDGRIYHGATGSAGEIGHMTIQSNGPLCSCGNHGCLESLAGGAAIARYARDAVASGRRTQLSTLAPAMILSTHVAEAAQRGDLLAQQIISEAGVYIGIAIASLINLFNPSMVIMGGSLSQLGDLLLEPVRKTVSERSLRPAANEARITSSVLGKRSSSLGAVVQAINLSLDRLLDV